ncbi:hypothetical protein L3Y34_013554 [Caenorhabditis briggsae]|uniref:Uncharacterized protein n=1 Tax=Caenorhabditis briggsae TaxID=6238 RepID=A0AAE8ZUM8_CAEBR|nr:hypothetical protein L3Y34_013554 [Caenorhabditis briggsae]
MSAAKPEKAQAPPLASQANNSGQVSHQQQQHQQQQPHQPHPHNYHQGQVVYQQPYNNHMQSYQQQGPPVWNQPPQSAVHYVHYGPQQGEPVNYQETGKVQGYNHYGTVHFTQPMDNGGMMMGDNSAGYGPQQYSQTWYPPGSQQQTTQFIPTYATTFNVANDPAYHPDHPMNRPNGQRQDEYQSGNESTSANYMQFVPFVAPIVESQAHASASYTANWVSSTSSIPPEMKDKPEENCFHNDDGPRSSSQMNGENWTDRENHMSPSTTQQPFQLPQQSRPSPYVEKDKAASQITTKTSKSAKGERSEEGRELTFDERLEKARMQKTRAENKGTNGESSSHLAAQHGSNQAVSPSSGNTPRSYGQRKEYSGPPRSNGGGYQNNSSQNNMRGVNNQARGGGSGNHNYNGNNNGGGAGEQYPRKQQQQQPQQYHQQQQHPNANQGRDRNNSKRVNDYSAYRYENNQNNSSYNQRNMQQNQVVPEFGRSPNYKGKNPRPYRGGYQGQGLQHQQPPPPPQQPNEGVNRYQGAPQIMNPQVMSTMNAFQNTHIGNVPLGGHRAPLLPGPFGMTRPPQIQQDAKFHNTWLDAASCPMPLAAVMSMDTRFGGFAPSYRGRGRGGAGGFAIRGGFRGTYENPRYTGRPAAEPVIATPRVVKQNDSTKPDETQPEKAEEKVEAKEESEVEKKVEEPAEDAQPETKLETPSEVKPTVTINIQPETPKHNASEEKKKDEHKYSEKKPAKKANEDKTTDESASDVGST